MARTPPKVVLDTNILISSLVYGGKPEQIVRLILDKKVIGVTSPTLLSELSEVLAKKFNFEKVVIQQTIQKIKKNFNSVQPTKILKVVKDEPDNRVLEAAIEGKCTDIITGDKELLKLTKYKNIKILTANKFLNELNKIQPI